MQVMLSRLNIVWKDRIICWTNFFKIAFIMIRQIYWCRLHNYHFWTGQQSSELANCLKASPSVTILCTNLCSSSDFLRPRSLKFHLCLLYCRSSSSYHPQRIFSPFLNVTAKDSTRVSGFWQRLSLVPRAFSIFEMATHSHCLLGCIVLHSNCIRLNGRQMGMVGTNEKTSR